MEKEMIHIDGKWVELTTVQLIQLAAWVADYNCETVRLVGEAMRKGALFGLLAGGAIITKRELLLELEKFKFVTALVEGPRGEIRT